MLLKFSASYADLHLFTPNSAPLPHPEAVTLSFTLSAWILLYFPKNKNIIMIVTNNTTTTKQPTKTVSTTERVMASTMSVDEYFDELISQVHEDYATV